MSQSKLASSPQLRTMFPDYWRINSLVRAEVSELDDSILDWTSDRWGMVWLVNQTTNQPHGIYPRPMVDREMG